jgi:glycosyltransferase involved in cell wall biosynthesis
MKLACVVHRYGPQATGGSEAHCRAIAQRLAERHDVTVLTSCATDYITWANALPAGPAPDGKVRVLRFPVSRTRHLNRFRGISERVYAERASAAEQIEWFRENGPMVPQLVSHLEQHGREYDRVIFWSFRYYPTWFGLPIVADRAVLVPTAEEEDFIRTATILGDFFARPRAYLFLTPEERALVASRTHRPLPVNDVVGSGLDADSTPPSRDALHRAGVPARFLLYLGRIERNKGADRLLDLYLDGAGQRPSVPLILAGPAIMPIPDDRRLVAVGVVDDATRRALLAHATALIMPSPYESLSLVVLEAWNQATPVLVNGRCKPLRGQVLRANGGLYYDLPGEFSEGLRVLSENTDVADEFGRNGLAYVDCHYRWPHVLDKIERILQA